MTLSSRPAFLLARKRAPRRAFSMVELLVVIGIMAIMAAVAIPALKGISGAGQFTQSVSKIAGAIDEARSYAVAQNTYVWVVLYKYTPPSPQNAVQGLYLAAFASEDGTDPLGVGNGTQSGGTVSGTSPPYSVTFNGETTKIVPIFRPQTYTSITYTDYRQPPTGYQAPLSYPDGSVSSPATEPQFIWQISPTIQLGQGGNTIWAVLEITPGGAVQINATPGQASFVGAVSMIFQPVLGNNQTDKAPSHQTVNAATIIVNGLTGLTTVYRTNRKP